MAAKNFQNIQQKKSEKVFFSVFSKSTLLAISILAVIIIF